VSSTLVRLGPHPFQFRSTNRLHQSSRHAGQDSAGLGTDAGSQLRHLARIRAMVGFLPPLGTSEQVGMMQPSWSRHDRACKT